MSYTSHSIVLDSAAIADAKETLQALMQPYAEQLASFSLAAAIAWLEEHLPAMPDVVTLLTWSNALEQLAESLPPTSVLWQQALRTEGYALRLRAHLFPHEPRT